MIRLLFASILAMSAAANGSAQTAPQPVLQSETAALASATTHCCLVPDGTIVRLEILDTLNSAQRRRGDKFRLRVAAPILVNGVEVVAAGTSGVGEIVHAAAARGGGAPGELLIAARFLELGAISIPLRGLKFGVTGGNNSGMALGVSFAAGPFAMFIRGREIEIPAGTLVQAKVAGVITLPSSVPADATIPQQSQPE
jgi:hypothetical protein